MFIVEFLFSASWNVWPVAVASDITYNIINISCGENKRGENGETISSYGS